MLSKIKELLYSLITNLDYQIGDNGTYRDVFPWLMMRTMGHQRVEMYDTRLDSITILIDIFSTYAGEKEIIEIADNISNHIQTLREEEPAITAIIQKDLKIMGDNGTGPVRQHGILSYQFVLTSSLLEDDDNGSTGN